MVRMCTDLSRKWVRIWWSVVRMCTDLSRKGVRIWWSVVRMCWRCSCSRILALLWAESSWISYNKEEKSTKTETKSLGTGKLVVRLWV